jgi:CBS domain-containing protein
MHVRDVLRGKSSQVISIGLDASVADAVARMVEHNIGSLPVIDGQGRLVGIFSERDVLRGLDYHGEEFRQMRVVTVMTCEPLTCRKDDDLNNVMGLMTARRIAKIPVLDDTRLVGIVSVGDMVKVMYEREHVENQHLLSYIHGGV